MDNAEAVESFMAVCGATNREKVITFLSDVSTLPCGLCFAVFSAQAEKDGENLLARVHPGGRGVGNGRVSPSLAQLENNLEAAIESFYELSDADKAEFEVAVEEPPVPPPDLGDFGGMVEEPVVRQRCLLLEISALSAHWKMVRGREHFVAGR